MRIATSTTYTQQANAIDMLEAQWQSQGEKLSTGKSLTAPSDDPTQIGMDLSVRTTISVQNQQTVNIQAATGQLTATDGALANLTSVLQSARQLATRGASDLLTTTQRQDLGNQVDQYLQQAITLANTQYGSDYVFAGTAQSSSAPVASTGSPISAVTFSGNNQSQAPMVFNGQSYALTPTLQQAFNYNATNGSPSVFQTLINLRDTIKNGLVADQSAQSINAVSQVIYGAGSPAAIQTTLATTGTSPFSVLPALDNGVPPAYSISIDNIDASGQQHVQAYTFYGTTAVDNATTTVPASPLSIVGAINANTATTGLTATFNTQTQRFSLTAAGGGAISISDVPSAGATTTANLTKVFGLTETATLPQTVSTQLGDIDHALDVTLSARSLVGTGINTLANINGAMSTNIVNNTAVQSGIEDTNVAQMTTQFSATQAALTASYSTTTRLESKHLFDYL